MVCRGPSEKHLTLWVVATLWDLAAVPVEVGRGRAFARPRTADLLAMVDMNLLVSLVR